MEWQGGDISRFIIQNADRCGRTLCNGAGGLAKDKRERPVAIDPVVVQNGDGK
jgi:hypothetical protein